MKKINFDSSKLKEICRQNEVAKLGVFGSYARNDAKSNSDIDFLVYFSTRKSLLDLVGLKNELSDFFQKKVDLLTEQAIHPRIREDILKDLKIIYEA